MADSDYSEDIETLIGKPKLSRESPRPKSAKKGSKKVKGSPYGVSSSSATKSAHELWLSAVKGGDSSRMSSFSGLKKAQMKGMSHTSTSHYLKQLVGGDATPRKSTDGTVKAAPGTPAYKSPEEYYDEVLALKKQIQDLNSSNSTLKLKIRRLEEDNLKKEKEIDQLLDPSKSDEMRRTLSEKRPDSSTVIHGLKQKVLKLEHQLKEREAAYHKLQSDLKSTKVEELKTQMECFYKEVMRLNQVKSVAPSQAQMNKSAPQVKETPSRLKALQETIMRMNEKNVRLTAENKGLKEDLNKFMEDKAHAKDKQSEYEDMSKKELLSSIGKLEKRLDKAEDSMSLVSDIENRGAKIEGKIKLEGTVSQKLNQLDQRETELLEELSKQRGLIKKVKEDRVHYRKKCEDKDKDIKALKKDIEEMERELDQFYAQDKSRTPRVSPRRPRSSDRKSSRASSVSSSEKERLRQAERMRENNAAKKIQKGWRKHHDDGLMADDERKKKVQEFTEQRAARQIQRGWIRSRGNKLAIEQEETAEYLQSALRGHSYRKKNMDHLRRHDSPDDTDTDTAENLQASMRSHKFRKDQIKRLHSVPSIVITDSEDDETLEQLQSTLRGHLARKGQINMLKASRSRSSSPRSRGQRYGGLDSEGEDMEVDSYNYRGGRKSPRTPPKRGGSSRKSPRHLADSDDDDDDDDDIVMPSASRRTKLY